MQDALIEPGCALYGAPSVKVIVHHVGGICKFKSAGPKNALTGMNPDDAERAMAVVVRSLYNGLPIF